VRKLSEYVKETALAPSLCEKELGKNHITGDEWARAVRKAVLDGIKLPYQKQVAIGKLIELAAESWGNDAMSILDKVLVFDVDICKRCEDCPYALPECPTCKTRQHVVEKDHSTTLMCATSWHCTQCGEDITKKE